MENIEDIRTKLEVAKAKRAEVEAQREAEAEEAKARRELEDLEKLEELEAEHGPLGEGLAQVVIADRFTVFLKKGGKAHWAKLKSYGDNIKEKQVIEFVKPHIVHPDVGTVVKLADEYPILWATLMEAMNHLAGIRREKLQGKS
ncbi:MAG: hypothetical protein H6718_04110 [Polyangiaceae bacterium]|nr:hypothetical protein [Polyangiaceae bacterium]